ncbi:MAG: hypothetical protein AAFY84_02885 [Pseudomonadota bacterium]
MLTFFTVLIAVLAGACGLYWRWSQKISEELLEGAEIAWDRYWEAEPEFLGDLTKQEFQAVYSKVNFPRFPKYVLGCLIAFVAALPIVFGILGLTVWIGDQTGLFAKPDQIAQYVPLSGFNHKSITEQQKQEMALYLARDFAGFYYFFGVIAAWLVTVALFARHFYRHRPGYLRDELIRTRDERGDN